MYLAGDDDQAILQWAGADVGRFIKEPDKSKKFLIYYKKNIPKNTRTIYDCYWKYIWN